MHEHIFQYKPSEYEYNCECWCISVDLWLGAREKKYFEKTACIIEIHRHVWIMCDKRNI